MHCHHLFFLLQFNTKCEEDDNDDNMFKHVIIVFCFVTVQLYEEETMREFSHIIFVFFLLQFNAEHEEEQGTSLVFWCIVVA
jgi:hypothetical protein